MYKSGVHWYVTVTWTPLYSGCPGGVELGLGEVGGEVLLETQEVHTQLPLTAVPNWT